MLDELNFVVCAGFLPASKVTAFLDARPSGLAVVLTGRGTCRDIVRRADYVTEMKNRKHPFDPRFHRDGDSRHRLSEGRAMVNFADRLIEACKARGSLVMVGIDPRLDHLPESVVKPALKRHGETLEGAAEAYAEFGRRVIDAVADVAVAVKPQSAFFEMLGPAGMAALREVIGHARQAGLLVVADVKRSDIGSTAEAYAQAFLGSVKVGGLTHQPWAADAVTVNPYLGSDGLDPFIAVAREHGRGVFVLVEDVEPVLGGDPGPEGRRPRDLRARRDVARRERRKARGRVGLLLARRRRRRDVSRGARAAAQPHAEQHHPHPRLRRAGRRGEGREARAQPRRTRRRRQRARAP